MSVTCLAISHDEKFLYSGSKDCSIIKWDFITQRKLYCFRGHAKQTNHVGHSDLILSLAISRDGILLASGSKDKTIRIWNTVTNNLIITFKGHRDAITGLAFRIGTHELYSASLDRALKIWNCDSMSYVTTCFGHIGPITDLDCFRKERALTSSLDKSVRLFKIPEQTQLVFSGPISPQDCVALLTDDFWVSGGIDGSLYLWYIRKKKPLYILNNAHGSNLSISSVATFPYSDIFATGSGSGQIKLWSWVKSESKVVHLKDINVKGWINNLKFSSSGKYLVAAVGRDQKLGRWSPLNVNSSVAIINLNNEPNKT